ncbi:hypothetical protein [Pseudoxanthomonas wuyuanensis]|uniref:hypothetical protein n=1 Tax=Pseudoxanthomonas wuyuanensis TaxID=1073196 RepID=UPI001389DDE6|nr:hypothetical protein [Pseudoxanthomonas wuyuanensis]
MAFLSPVEIAKRKGLTGSAVDRRAVGASHFSLLDACCVSPFGPASPFAPQSGTVVPFAKTKGTRTSVRLSTAKPIKLLILPLLLPLP